MRLAERVAHQAGLALAAGLAATCLMAASLSASAHAEAPCAQPVYLTLDTGHMGVAPLVAEVLARQQVKVTFFLANERTQRVGGRPEGSTLDEHWAPWWKSMAQAGHDFGSHTWDHLVWRADQGGSLLVQPTSGPQQGRKLTLTPAQYCAELAHSADRFQAMTGQPMRALFRAPGGKTSPQLLKVAQACGWHHVPWSAAGFLGDELPSDLYPNDRLLKQALRDIRPGDILLAHLGIWSRQDPWAPAVLEPLIVGLKARGLCFATLRDHPLYRSVGPAPLGKP
jgi:peptidoglycan-N-acetylmuramic acid deacetylase